ncbi:MAG: hypothetical protein IJF88_04350 [Oscillospiraceae bacterium]|nr:hypothetical protein [Oscillospiraceae bacterium]MBQ9411956.1 hypothetical protein [Oscillospiraceae bacterium]
MKTSRFWIVAVLLALLCVGTVLALYLSKDETPLSDPVETSAPAQRETQPAEHTPEAAPGQSAAPEAPSPVEQTGESTGTPGADSPAPTESAAPTPTERATPAPWASQTPAPGVTQTPVPGERHTPAPQDSAAPVPTATTQPGTHTPAPPDTAAPTTHTPAVTNSAETAAPATPAPTVPVSPGGSGQDAARINELYASLNALRSAAVSQLAALANQAEAEWLSIRDSHPSKKDFVLKYYDQASGLEASYDAQVDAVCNELQYLLNKTGGDSSVVRQIRAEYEAEKESARSAYYQRFLSLLT